MDPGGIIGLAILALIGAAVGGHLMYDFYRTVIRHDGH